MLKTEITKTETVGEPRKFSYKEVKEQNGVYTQVGPMGGTYHLVNIGDVVLYVGDDSVEMADEDLWRDKKYELSSESIAVKFSNEAE